MTIEDVFDLAVIAQTREALGAARLGTVLEVMAQTSREEADLVTYHVAVGEFDEARRIAHGIAGGALSIGAARLGKAAREIEFSVKPTAAHAAALVSAVEETLATIPKIARGLGSG